MKEYCLAMVIKQDYWHATISLGQIPTKIHVHSIFKQTKSHVFFDKICQHNYYKRIYTMVFMLCVYKMH